MEKAAESWLESERTWPAQQREDLADALSSLDTSRPLRRMLHGAGTPRRAARWETPIEGKAN